MRPRQITLIASPLLLLVAFATSALGASWKKDLTNRVAETYKPSHISVWDGALREGYDVLVVIQPGVFAWPARDGGYPNTQVTEGKLKKPRGADTQSGAREFRKGEKVLIFDMEADSDDGEDYLRLSLLSMETTERQEGGNTVGTRHKGAVSFMFPYKTLANTDFATVKAAINTVLVPEAEYEAFAVPATIRLGMTPQETEQALGKPQKVIDLGSKKLYVYPDLKVTFVEGKVTDVQ